MNEYNSSQPGVNVDFYEPYGLFKALSLQHDYRLCCIHCCCGDTGFIL